MAWKGSWSQLGPFFPIPGYYARQLPFLQPHHHLGTGGTQSRRDAEHPLHPHKLSRLQRSLHLQGHCDSAEGSCSPDPLVSVPPKRDHFVNLKGSGPVGAAHSSPQGAVLHLGQEILGKRASHVVIIPVL